MTTILTITLTEQDVRDIVTDGNLGNAIGECPMNEAVAVALVREFADAITNSAIERIEDVIGRLADNHARITDPTV